MSGIYLFNLTCLLFLLGKSSIGASPIVPAQRNPPGVINSAFSPRYNRAAAAPRATTTKLGSERQPLLASIFYSSCSLIALLRCFPSQDSLCRRTPVARFRARVHTHTHTHTPLGYLGKQQTPNNSLPANSYPANSHPTSSFQIAPRTPRLSEVVHRLQLAAGLRSELSCSHLVLEKRNEY